MWLKKTFKNICFDALCKQVNRECKLFPTSAPLLGTDKLSGWPTDPRSRILTHSNDILIDYALWHGAWHTFGLFGWLRLGLWTGALSAAPNMLLVGPPGALVRWGWAEASGSPNIPLVFPPIQSITKTDVKPQYHNDLFHLIPGRFMTRAEHL